MSRLSLTTSISNHTGLSLSVTTEDRLQPNAGSSSSGSRGTHPLRGVVNIAGVVGVVPLIEMSEQELTFVLNVNLFGPYRITKAFAPLLLATRGCVAAAAHWFVLVLT